MHNCQPLSHGYQCQGRAGPRQRLAGAGTGARRGCQPRAGGLQEGPGDDLVADLVGVLVGPAGRGGALPGPLAQQGDIARDAAGSAAAEVSGLEGAEHVRHPGAGLGVDAIQQLVVGGGQPFRGPGDHLTRQAIAPFGERGQVVVHPDHADTGRGRLQADHDRVQVRDGARDAGHRARGELAEAGLAAAVFRVVGADVDGEQEHPAAVGVQEGDGRGQLRSALVAAYPAVDHRAGRLTRATQLDQPQRGVARTQRRVDLIGIAIPGLHAGTGRVGLDAPRQRVAQREVIGGLGHARGRAVRRYRPGAPRDRHDGGDGQRDAEAHDAQDAG